MIVAHPPKRMWSGMRWMLIAQSEAIGTRLSLRPPFESGRDEVQSSRETMAARTRSCIPPSAVIARLDRAIQYAAASRLKHWRLWNTGSPAFAGDDTGQ